MSTLFSKIRLCKNIKLDKEYRHVLSYTENEMLALCESNGHLFKSADNFSFIKSTGEIRVNWSYGDCIQCNYMAFQNPNYSNKWFFAFIDSIEYIAESTTKINYTVDVWSTWFSYWQKKPCFVEREHVSDDTIGANTVDENLNVGEVVTIAEFETFSTSSFYIAIASTHRPADNTDFVGVSCYNKQIFGFELHLIPVMTELNLTDLIGYILKTATDKSSVDCISDMFIVPYELINVPDLIQHQFQIGNENYSYYTLPYDLNVKSYEFNQITKNYNWSNYQPKNNKCNCYPYNYLMLTNNQGSQNIYKYEDFADNNCIFKIIEAIGIGCSVLAVPKNYKGSQENLDESIALGKYPVCRLVV